MLSQTPCGNGVNIFADQREVHEVILADKFQDIEEEFVREVHAFDLV